MRITWDNGIKKRTSILLRVLLMRVSFPVTTEKRKATMKNKDKKNKLSTISLARREATMSREKYVVISYDDDQQQMFVDIVSAISADEALEKTLNRRPYAQGGEAFTSTDLLGFAYSAMASDVLGKEEK